MEESHYVKSHCHDGQTHEGSRTAAGWRYAGLLLPHRLRPGLQKNKAGEKETDFVDVVVWRKMGENVAKYFSKGRMAVVSGRLQIRPWTDQEGNKRYSTEIVAEHVYFGDSSPRRRRATPAGRRRVLCPTSEMRAVSRRFRRRLCT